MKEISAYNWRGKCRHLKWVTVGFAFNSALPPSERMKRRDSDYLSEEDRLKIEYGFTTVTQQCRTCEKVQSYTTPGRTQA